MGAMKKIRAFIAVHLPEAVTAALHQINQKLASQMPPRTVRWVTPERMHLTLRFLGDTVVSRLPALYEELDRTAARHAPLTLQLQELGCFPNRRRPRVIWVGLQGRGDAWRRLQNLKQEIDESLVPLGWELEDRPFRAHLTLGRVKDGRRLRDVRWGAEVEKLDVPVTAVHLIESQLRPDGPIYTVRHSSELGKEA